jgi:hypothetical protein
LYVAGYNSTGQNEHPKKSFGDGSFSRREIMIFAGDQSGQRAEPQFAEGSGRNAAGEARQ